MRYHAYRWAIVLLAGLPFAQAQGQLEGLADKGAAQSALGGLTSKLPRPALAPGSLGNVAGLLQYCVTNDYLSGETVNPIKEKLMGKLPGGSNSTDPGYTDGLKGLLHSKEGKQVDLSSAKKKLAKRACNVVLSRAKSLL